MKFETEMFDFHGVLYSSRSCGSTSFAKSFSPFVASACQPLGQLFG